MKINQLKLGSLLSYVQMFLGLVINIAYTPIMLRLLGQSEYGLYNTVASTISMLSVLNLGFNSSYIRFYSKYKAKDDEDSIAKLNGLFLIIFLIIGGVALICGTFLTVNLNIVFDAGLTAAEYETARVLMLLLTVNLAVSFPMSVFSSIISANERYVFLKLLGALKTVLSPLISLPLLLMGYGSVAMVAATLVIAVFTDVLYLLYSKKVLHVKFSFRNFEKGIFVSLLAFTSFIAINLIVDQVNSNMGKYLLGRYKGTSVVAVYSVGYTIYQCYMMFSNAVSGVFSPRIHKIVNTAKESLEQRNLLTSLFTKVGRIQFIILSLVCTGIIFFGKPFIRFWAGEGYSESYYVAVLLTLSVSVALIQNLGIEIQRALNKHKFRSFAYVGMAIVNLVATVFLCQRYGAVGTAVGTSISFLLANGLVMNIYYHKKCNIDILFFWKNIFRLAVGLIIPVAAGIFIKTFFAVNTLLSMFVGIVVYTAVFGVSMWFAGMNEYEKNLVKSPVMSVLRKIRK